MNNPKPLEQLRDFRAFCHYVWKTSLNFPEGITPYQEDIADYIQNLPMQKDKKHRGQIQAHRGAGKSYLTAAYVAWHGYWNPDSKIVVVSSTAQRAQEFVSLTKQIIRNNDLLKHMAPRIGSEGSPTGKDQIDNAQSFDFGHLNRPAKDPSVVAYGINATMTGCHPDVIVSDDIESLDNGLTAGGREKLMRKVAEFESLIQPKGTILILGTPQSMESIYMQLKEQFPIRRWPVQFPDPEDSVACEYVTPWIMEKVTNDESCIGLSTHPERFDDVELEVKKTQYGDATFYLQMLLNTSLADAERYPLKLKDLMVMDCDVNETYTRIVWGTAKSTKLKMSHPGLDGDFLCEPAWVQQDEHRIPYDRKVMFIDPAGKGADETAYCVAASCAGMLYVLSTGGFDEGFAPSTLKGLAKVADKYGVGEVHVEANFGSGTFTQLLVPVMAEHCGPVDINEYTVTKNKEQRILDVMEPIVFNHQLVIDTSVAKDKTFLYQYSHASHQRGNLKHDDRIDCVASALMELNQTLTQSLDKASLDAQRQAFEERVENWESYFRTANGAGPIDFERRFGKEFRGRGGRNFKSKRTWNSGTSRRGWK